MPGYQRPRSEVRPAADPAATPSQNACDAVRADHWRRVAVIASACITRVGSATPTHDDLRTLLAWWHLRLVSLWKLQLVELVHTEMDALWTALDSLLVFHEGALCPLSTTPLVPYPLAVLRAQDLFERGSHREAVERFWMLIQTAETRNGIWTRRATRVRIVLASLLAMADELPAAATVLRDVRIDTPYTALALARLYLRMGELEQAERLVETARERSAALPADEAFRWEHALTSHVALCRFIGQPHVEHVRLQDSPSDDQALVTSIAVDAFHNGDTATATSVLERLMREHPTIFATSRTPAANLLTLHSLGPHG